MRYNKGITIAIGVFVFIFMMSVVYALGTGQLEIGGTATFSAQADVDLIIVDADFAASTPARIEQDYQELVDVPSILDYHTMFIEVDLLYPGDIRIIEFSIENIENTSTKLGPIISDYESGIADETTGIKITWPDLEDEVILGSQKSGPYQIIIEWDMASYSPGQTGSHNFSATLSYQQGT